MTPAQINRLGAAAIRRCEDLHGGRDGLQVIRQAGAAALASLREVRGGRSDSEIILLAGQQALDRQRRADGGKTPIEKIFAAHQHGQDISGEEMLSKALSAGEHNPFATAATDLGALLASMQAEPAPASAAELGAMPQRSPMVEAALRAETIRRDELADRLAAMKEAQRLRPPVAVAPHAVADGYLSNGDVSRFGDAMKHALRQGVRFQGQRHVVEHAHQHWNLPRSASAELLYRLQDRVLAERAERGAPV